MKHAQHLRLIDPIESTIRQRSGGREPDRLCDQAAFAEEIAVPEYRDHRFLAAGGGDTEFHLAPLDVIDAVGTISLREDDLLRLASRNCPTTAHRLEKRMRVRSSGFLTFWHYRSFHRERRTAHFISWVRNNCPFLLRDVRGGPGESATTATAGNPNVRFPLLQFIRGLSARWVQAAALSRDQIGRASC